MKWHLEKSPYDVDAGNAIGKDPRTLGESELSGFQHKTLKAAVRAKCLDCCGHDQSEVRKCVSVDCPLWPFRMNKNPFASLKAKADGRKVGHKDA